jgi:hypothetical protein
MVWIVGPFFGIDDGLITGNWVRLARWIRFRGIELVASGLPWA